MSVDALAEDAAAEARWQDWKKGGPVLDRKRAVKLRWALLTTAVALAIWLIARLS